MIARLLLELPSDLKKQLKTVASAQGRSMRSILEQLIRSYVKRHTKE